MKHVTHFVQNKPWDGVAARQGDIFDPATGARTGLVDLASAEEVGAVVDVARAAFPEWRRTSLTRRTEVMFRFRNLLDQHRDEVAAMLSAEHGKVRSDALGEVSRGIEVVELACGIAQLMKGEYSENVSTRVNAYSIRQPLGVVAGITPFNFPAMVPLWMFPLAVAAGNTFVLKPSEKVPSASVLLAELFAEAGLPPGVLSVVQGDREAVDALLGHPGVAAVSFVGSTAVARHVYETATRAGKRVQALGGAKNHMIVMPDADLDDAADAAVSAGYGSAGERCMAVSALLAVGAAADPLVEKIRERVARLRVGPASDPESEMGPLITAEHRDRVAAYLDRGRDEGARIAVDGREVPTGGDPGGFFLAPCLLDGVTPEMSVYRDEIFGPVLSVLRVDSLEEALALVRENPYGNGAAIFTNDGRAARTFEQEADAGMIGINVPIPVPVAYYSFGGWKQSLFGDLAVYGPDGVRFYTRGKSVTSRWHAAPAAGALAFPTNS